MTFASLHTTAALMKAKEGDTLFNAGITLDADIIALKETQAKEEMKWDLQEALNLTYDNTDFESYLTDNQSFLQEALSNKQLYLWFLGDTGGQGSANYIKALHYKDSYEQMRKKMHSLLVADVQSFESTRIKR